MDCSAIFDIAYKNPTSGNKKKKAGAFFGQAENAKVLVILKKNVIPAFP